MRASIVEQMPDPLSPLFADLIEGSVVRSLRKLLNELFGTQKLREDDLGFPIINGYAYYHYRLAAFWRLLLLTPSAYRDVFNLGVRRWGEYSRPRYAQTVERWEARSLEDLRMSGLLAGVQDLLDAGAEYYTSVQTIIPLAASNEILFTGFYDRLIRRQGDPPARTFLLGFDSMPIRAEKSLYDLAMWSREHPDLAAALTGAPSDWVLDLLQTDQPAAGVDETVWREWQSRFREHLDRYGRMIYNLDFVNPVPADDPAPPFDTLKFYVRSEGTNPHERQRRAATRREETTEAVLARLDAPRRAIFQRLLRWAQNIAPVREDALADVGLAWPVMRRTLLELGRRLVEAGAIEKSADVFWLRRDELDAYCPDELRCKRNVHAAAGANRADLYDFSVCGCLSGLWATPRAPSVGRRSAARS